MAEWPAYRGARCARNGQANEKGDVFVAPARDFFGQGVTRAVTLQVLRPSGHIHLSIEDAVEVRDALTRALEWHGIGRCDNCGHVLGSHCMECNREFVCGEVGIPCPEPGCREGVLPDARRDSKVVWREVPRRDHPSDAAGTVPA